MNEQAGVHVLIAGSVQGVGFRYALREVAQDAGVRGWVRNLRDGRVEARLEGDRAAVQVVLDWCRHGPPGARVRDVAAEWGAPLGEPEGFRIERSAS